MSAPSSNAPPGSAWSSPAFRPERASPATFVATYLAPMILLPLSLVLAMVGGAVLAWRTRRSRDARAP